MSEYDPSDFVPDFERERELLEQEQEARQHFEDFRNDMISRFPNTQLIVAVSQAIPHAPRYYGPFSNGATMCAWLALQPRDINYRVIALRNPTVKRTRDDFYNPAKDNDDQEFIVDYGQNNN